MRCASRTVMHRAIAMLMFTATSVQAYPEFQEFVQNYSGRNVDCALCHSHPDGPEGLQPGQIGGLTPSELDQLATARAAFAPGQEVNSPILNEFGNHIIHTIGKTEFLKLRLQPEDLAAMLLAHPSDLDHDGIDDAVEYLDGTHPIIAHSGVPMKLFAHNVHQSLWHIVMLAVATVFGLWGLNNLLRWFYIISQPSSNED